MFPSPRVECASVEHTIGTPASSAQPHVLVAEVEPGGEPVHLERDAGLERDLEHPLEVERVRRPVVDQPAGRMAEARRRRMAHRLHDARRQLPARRPLAGVEADLHPVELGQHVVGQVERPVREDVALGAAEQPERCELPRSRPRSRRPAGAGRRRRARARPARRACGRRSRGTRSRAPRRRAPSRARSPSRPTSPVWTWRSPRIVLELEELRRRVGRAGLAQLRRRERQAEQPVDLLLGRGVRQWRRARRRTRRSRSRA